MGWNLADIRSDALRRQLRTGLETVAARPSYPVVKHDAGKTLVKAPPDEERRAERRTVRITRHACRLLDFDNGAGGCKFLCDVLRYEKIIDDDDPGTIDFQFRQVRVQRKKDQGTLIEVEIEPGACNLTL